MKPLCSGHYFGAVLTTFFFNDKTVCCSCFFATAAALFVSVNMNVTRPVETSHWPRKNDLRTVAGTLLIAHYCIKTEDYTVH